MIGNSAEHRTLLEIIKNHNKTIFELIGEYGRLHKNRGIKSSTQFSFRMIALHQPINPPKKVCIMDCNYIKTNRWRVYSICLYEDLIYCYLVHVRYRSRYLLRVSKSRKKRNVIHSNPLSKSLGTR